MAIPIGDDNSDRRTTPVVNYVLIAFNIFVFFYWQQLGHNVFAWRVSTLIWQYVVPVDIWRQCGGCIRTLQISYLLFIMRLIGRAFSCIQHFYTGAKPSHSFTWCFGCHFRCVRGVYTFVSPQGCACLDTLFYRHYTRIPRCRTLVYFPGVEQLRYYGWGGGRQCGLCCPYRRFYLRTVACETICKTCSSTPPQIIPEQFPESLILISFRLTLWGSGKPCCIPLASLRKEE